LSLTYFDHDLLFNNRMNTSSDDVYYSETSGDKKPVIKLNLLTSMSEPSDKSECRLANLTRIIDEMTHSGLYQVESKLTDLRSQTINLIDAEIDHPEINRALQNMVNKTKSLPSFDDVLETIEKTNENYELQLR